MTDFYIVSMPQSDEGVYVFTNLDAVISSLCITWSNSPIKAALVKLSRNEWEIRLSHGDRIGIVRHIYLDKAYTEGTHF